jgi:hypothetical protein
MQVTFWQHLGNFFYSNAFVGVVALVVGFAAYRVYAKQKRDTKRDAANIILMEIENAERQLEKVNPDKPFAGPDGEDTFLMPSASWDKTKYLFGRDFDRNEWDKINGFYTKCLLYDEAVRLNNNYFDKNQQELRVNLQHSLADYARTHAESLKITEPEDIAALEKEYADKRKQYTDTMVGNTDIDHMFMYMPVKAENDAKRALKNLETSLSLTSVGIKLKKLADKNTVFSRFKRWLGSFSNSK